MSDILTHSPEPWSQGCWAGNTIHDSTGLSISETAIDDIGIKNAARIVSCVNACQSMESPEDEINKLRALKAYAEHSKECPYRPPYPPAPYRFQCICGLDKLLKKI